MRNWWIIALGLLLTAGCSDSYENDMPIDGISIVGTNRTPAFYQDHETGTQHFELSVLTYNIAGLPWPLKGNRSTSLKIIGEELARMRAEGSAPHIVMIQEGFSAAAHELVRQSDYPHFASGPDADDSYDGDGEDIDSDFLAARSLFKGEKIGKWLGSGLHILSEWPVETVKKEAFHEAACGGYDCATNKGILWAEVEVPGMPGRLQLMTTHLNSNDLSGVSAERARMARDYQTSQLARFLNSNWDGNLPFVFGADFNIKYVQDRKSFQKHFSHWRGRSRMITPSRYCLSMPKCFYDIPVDDKRLTPIAKQDWQGAVGGRAITVRPISVSRLFHQPYEGASEIAGHKTLSDHDGLLVRYQLSWKSEN